MLNFERIELQGFKSFADKVKIELLDGITAIVGPNGCGKSNVADAIKWVLGEQSAKTLRGTSMQDVIFNGTETRKSLSYCEVSLVFNNTEKIFPSLEYTEVVMTRKLYRNGDSEYFMNRQPCRLKDIIDALHECGVSKDGYTVIEQGKVTEIFSSKPEDRRAIFEEAVGIAKTKKDRKETIAKLNRTNDNITRVSDILTERERQLEPLSKAADKTRAFRALSEQLKHHEINTYLYKFENASDTKRKINDKIQGLSEEISARQKELEETIKAYNLHQEEILSADEVMRQLNEEITNASVNIERQTGDAKVFAQKISFLRSENARIGEENNAINQKIAELKSTLASRKKYGKECNAKIIELDKKAEELNALITKLTSEISAGEDNAQSVQNKMLKSVENLADINKNIGSLSAEQNVITKQQKDVIEKVNALVDKYNAISLDNERNELELNSAESFIEETKEKIKSKEEEVASINDYVSTLNNKIYLLNNTLTSANANLKVYNGLKESYDGYGYAVKSLMTSAKTDNEVGKRIKGVVASIITTDKEYETAIETAIGGAMQNIVTATTEDAEYLINYLKRNNLGRVTFLPVTSVKSRINGSDIVSALKEAGAIDLATNLVKYDGYYENIISFLLGGTLIVKDLASARLIATKYHFNFKIVTLDGDVLATTGSMSGGSRKKHDSSLLSIDRQITELTELINKNKAELNRLENDKQDLLSQVNSEVDELNTLTEALTDTKQRVVSLREKVISGKKLLEDTEAQIEKNKDEIAIISTRLDQIKTAYTDIEAGNEKLVKEKEDATTAHRENQEKYNELRRKRDELLSENTSIQSNLSFLRAEITSVTNDEERINTEIEDNNAILVKNAETTVANDDIIEKIKKQAEKVTLSKEEQENLEALRAKRSEFEEKKKNLNELVSKDNLRRDMLQADITRNTDKKTAEEISLAKVDTDLEYMSQNIFNEYQLTYETCDEFRDENYDISMSQQEISSLKRKISNLGNINPGAIEEYNELNEAYQELLAQRDDLVKAQEDLEKVIADLTKEMALTFDEGFKTIKTNFSKIFKELFGGGSADLIVEPSETGDPLDAGIEIVAEPPGKKLQKISLLSGGEKSLTAIAILFSILKLRPMPFCVLDEIEAALDDANVDRFAKYLRNFSKETQFICITHKKVTMENADGLFGVTMPEKGVSSIVSVKLSDVADMGEID